MRRGEDNIKMDLKQVENEAVEWIHLTLNRIHLWALVSMIGFHRRRRMSWFVCNYQLLKKETMKSVCKQYVHPLTVFRSTILKVLRLHKLSWIWNMVRWCEIWGSHGGEDVDVGLLGCNAVWTCRYIPTFRRDILSLSSPWRWRQYVPPKRWYIPTSPHGVTTKKTNMDMVYWHHAWYR
jgi:hypothetical protein